MVSGPENNPVAYYLSCVPVVERVSWQAILQLPTCL